MSYMNCTATLLSGGYATRPVAILYHADAEWAGSAIPIERVAAELTRAQIDLILCPPRLLRMRTVTRFLLPMEC